MPLLEGREVRPPSLGLFLNGHNLEWGKIAVHLNQLESYQEKEFDFWSRTPTWLFDSAPQIELQGRLGSTFGSGKRFAWIVFRC